MRSLHTSIFAIGLFGDRLEVALCRRGEIVATRQRPMALGDTTEIEVWAAAARESAPALREMVEHITAETSTRVRRAIVVYASPSAVGDCMSFAVRNAGQARAAASLAVMDSMKCSIDTVVSGSLFLERDSTGSRAGATRPATPGGAESRSQRTHVLTAADSESVLNALQSMMNDAGLRFLGAVPVQAVVAATALAQAADRQSPILTVEHGASAEGRERAQSDFSEGPLAHLHIAEFGSFLLVRERQHDSISPGNIRFTRSIPLGMNALAACLIRPETTATDLQQEGPGEPVASAKRANLSADDARCALLEFGLPSDPHAVHQPTGLTAHAVLPLIQPLVQRMIVELRQSLRFALDAAERSSTAMIVSGPGAAVPGLADALGRETNMPVFLRRPDGERGDPAGETDLGQAIDSWLRGGSNSISELALLPRELARRISNTRLRRGLWAGAAAALLFIAIDSGRLSSHLLRARLDHAAGAASISPAGFAAHSPFFARVVNEPEEMLALVNAAQEFRAAVDRETARRVDFRACMQELSRIATPSVRFASVNVQPAGSSARNESGRITATIAGVARASSIAPARSELERFVLQLRSSPLFDDVSLGQVHIEPEASSEQRFEVHFSVPSTPAVHDRTPSKGAGEGVQVEVTAASPGAEGGDQ